MKLQDMSDVSDVDFDVLSLVDFEKWSDKGLPENRRQLQARFYVPQATFELPQARFFWGLPEYRTSRMLTNFFLFYNVVFGVRVYPELC